jgi:hypothetical protein
MQPETEELERAAVRIAAATAEPIAADLSPRSSPAVGSAVPAAAAHRDFLFYWRPY